MRINILFGMTILPPIQRTAYSRRTISGMPFFPTMLMTSCYLNEPAGLVAKTIISYAVTKVVAAWSNELIDARATVDSILQCFCHPAFLSPLSQLQQSMFATVEAWIERQPADRKARILDGLTREGVRQGRHYDDEIRKVQV